MTLGDYVIAIGNAASFGDAIDLLEQFRDSVLDEAAVIADKRAILSIATRDEEDCDNEELHMLSATQAAAEEIAADIRKLKVWREN